MWRDFLASRLAQGWRFHSDEQFQAMNVHGYVPERRPAVVMARLLSRGKMGRIDFHTVALCGCLVSSWQAQRVPKARSSLRRVPVAMRACETWSCTGAPSGAPNGNLRLSRTARRRSQQRKRARSTCRSCSRVLAPSQMWAGQIEQGGFLLPVQ